jgi:ureidoglycolate lyase
MQLVRFSKDKAPGQVGLLFGDKVVPLSSVIADASSDMRAVIANWDDIAPKLEDAKSSSAAVPLASVELLAPVEAPEKILAIGLNYADHVEEARDSGITIPTEQVWFSKMPSSVNASNGDIQMPKVSDKLDYEVEMVAVIGKGGRHISREDAPKHVFGYAVGNDVSVRDWQMKTAQWVLGKSFDTHAPVGPIVTADEIGDPHRLAIKCYVNGELRQNSNTKHLIFNVWDQIAELSIAMTLKPGDLIFTGTPGGVGLGFKPPRLLKVGDVVRSEIEELGAIENKVVAEA